MLLKAHKSRLFYEALQHGGSTSSTPEHCTVLTMQYKPKNHNTLNLNQNQVYP